MRRDLRYWWHRISYAKKWRVCCDDGYRSRPTFYGVAKSVAGGHEGWIEYDPNARREKSVVNEVHVEERHVNA